MTSRYLFSFRGCKTLKIWKNDDTIGHTCRSSFHMPGVAVIQHLHHLNRVSRPNQQSNDVQMIEKLVTLFWKTIHLGTCKICGNSQLKIQ